PDGGGVFPPWQDASAKTDANVNRYTTCDSLPAMPVSSSQGPFRNGVRLKDAWGSRSATKIRTRDGSSSRTADGSGRRAPAEKAARSTSRCRARAERDGAVH